MAADRHSGSGTYTAVDCANIPAPRMFAFWASDACLLSDTLSNRSIAAFQLSSDGRAAASPGSGKVRQEIQFSKGRAQQPTAPVCHWGNDVPSVGRVFTSGLKTARALIIALRQDNVSFAEAALRSNTLSRWQSSGARASRYKKRRRHRYLRLEAPLSGSVSRASRTTPATCSKRHETDFTSPPAGVTTEGGTIQRRNHHAFRGDSSA